MGTERRGSAVTAPPGGREGAHGRASFRLDKAAELTEPSPCRTYRSHKRREKKKTNSKNNPTATSSDLTVISFYFLHSFINNT